MWKELSALVLDLLVGHRVRGSNPQTLQKRFVRKVTQESLASILDKEVQDSECSQLAVDGAIFAITNDCQRWYCELNRLLLLLLLFVRKRG